MSGKQIKRPKHIPQRTCVGCHTVLPKQSLVRIVRHTDGVRVDPTGKLAGRGAYLHNRRSCWEKGLKGALAHALKVTLSPDDLEGLRQFMGMLPEDDRQDEASMG
ncbi:MAG: YlxR family protein [Chloroflexi bacterium]|nr:YlxR family protein [Chloroflexota bacterium]